MSLRFESLIAGACCVLAIPSLTLTDQAPKSWRGELVVGKKPPVDMTTKLSKLQRRILRLLGMRMAYDN